MSVFHLENKKLTVLVTNIFIWQNSGQHLKSNTCTFCLCGLWLGVNWSTRHLFIFSHWTLVHKYVCTDLNLNVLSLCIARFELRHCLPFFVLSTSSIHFTVHWEFWRVTLEGKRTTQHKKDTNEICNLTHPCLNSYYRYMFNIYRGKCRHVLFGTT